MAHQVAQACWLRSTCLQHGTDHSKPDLACVRGPVPDALAPSSKGSSSNASGEGAGLYINVGAGLQGSVGLGHGPGTPTDSAPAALAASSVAFSAADSNPNLALPPVKEVLTKPATEPPFPPPHAPPPQWNCWAAGLLSVDKLRWALWLKRPNKFFRLYKKKPPVKTLDC
eukprot:scaffold90572_cov17-Tisochrysis_lutea.AAC.4